MRVACLQLAPDLGQPRENIARADALLKDLSPGQCDLLVLPEMAFSGYNFPSLDAIRPFLEPTGKGVSSAWAKVTAARLRCLVTVGYPELESVHGPNQNQGDPIPTSVCYNSTITVSPLGETLAHYRKTHLYYTDETWAQESGTKWLTTDLPLKINHGNPSRTTRTSFGICMDLNPYKFTAPWTLYEFASDALKSKSQLLLLSMAWLTHKTSAEILATPDDPDLDTLSYWVKRIAPLVNNEDGEAVVVFANRCGEEPTDARYAGSSWIGQVGFGEIKIWDIAGRAQEKLLCVDTQQEPKFHLRTSSCAGPP